MTNKENLKEWEDSFDNKFHTHGMRNNWNLDEEYRPASDIEIVQFIKELLEEKDKVSDFLIQSHAHDIEELEKRHKEALDILFEKHQIELEEKEKENQEQLKEKLKEYDDIVCMTDKIDEYVDEKPDERHIVSFDAYDYSKMRKKMTEFRENL